MSVDISEGERLLASVAAAQKKRDAKETHEAALLEFMCAEARLSNWLRENVEELFAAVRKCQQSDG